MATHYNQSSNPRAEKMGDVLDALSHALSAGAPKRPERVENCSSSWGSLFLSKCWDNLISQEVDELFFGGVGDSKSSRNLAQSFNTPRTLLGKMW